MATNDVKRVRRRRRKRSRRVRLWNSLRFRMRSHPFRRRRSGRKATRFGRIRWFVSLVMWPVWALIWTVAGLVKATSKALVNAWRHRETRHLVQGLPALACAIAFLAVTASAFHQRPNLVNRYRDAALAAFRQKDFEAAKVYFERLTAMDGASESGRFDLALTLANLDRNERADAIMSDLAPIEKMGFPRAHLWVARRLLSSRKPGNQDVNAVQTAYRHLMLAREGLGDRAGFDWEIAQCHLAAGRPREALSFVTRAAASAPELNYELAVVCAALGENELARQASRRAKDHYSGRVMIAPHDEGLRLRLASACMNLVEFDEAVRILTEGVQLKPEGPCGKALVAAFVTQYDRLAGRRNVPAATLLHLLRNALEHDPDSEAALIRLLHFGDNAAEEKRAKEVLESLLVTGRENPYVHFVLGCKAWSGANSETALWHLERAYKLDQNLGPVANNLAWMLARQETPEFERALRIMDSVVTRWPAEAEYRDTRGQILAKLERWEDALDDLELALAGMQTDSQLHRALTQVYEHLGQADLANKHAKVAAAIETAQETQSELPATIMPTAPEVPTLER